MSDLEHELRKLQPRTPPAHWRREILEQCEAETPHVVEIQRSAWREWLWPSPLSWGALAAIWIALAAIRPVSPSSGPSRHEASAVSTEPGFLVARRQYQAVLASLR